MFEVQPPNAPDPRSVLFWDGTYWRMATVDAGGRLHVRGEDQLFSIEQVLAIERTAIISGADGWIDSAAVPAGRYWIVTAIFAFDGHNPTTRHQYTARHDGANVRFYHEIAAFAAAQSSDWGGHVYLDQADTIQVSFTGAKAGDSCTVSVLGYQVTVEP